MQKLRTRLFKILNGETPDRLPWYGDLSYWHYAMSMKGALGKRYDGLEGLLTLHKELGVGHYYPGYSPYTPVYKNCKVTEVERNVGSYSTLYKNTAYMDTVYRGKDKNTTVIKNSSNNDLIREVITPIGSIKEIWTYFPESFSWATREFFVKSADDLKVLKYWIGNTDYRPDYEQLNIAKDLVGEQGCVVCHQNKSPLMDLIHWYAGIITTMNIMIDNRKEFDEIIKILQNKADQAAEIALGTPADIILVPENLHADLVGKNLYKEFLKESYEKWNKDIKDSGKYSSIHMDGTLKNLLGEISEVNFSIIEALTPKPLGDLSIGEFENYIKSDSVMWGGIPGVMFTDLYNDEDFENFVLGVIEKMTTKPKYVLGIADVIPPNGIIDRVKKVTELVEKYGIYKTD